MGIIYDGDEIYQWHYYALFSRAGKPVLTLEFDFPKVFISRYRDLGLIVCQTA